MILECDTCRTKIEVSLILSWRFTNKNILGFLQAVHFSPTYTYDEFPILNKPVKVNWAMERCSGSFTIITKKDVKGD